MFSWFQTLAGTGWAGRHELGGEENTSLARAASVVPSSSYRICSSSIRSHHHHQQQQQQRHRRNRALYSLIIIPNLELEQRITYTRSSRKKERALLRGPAVYTTVDIALCMYLPANTSIQQAARNLVRFRSRGILNSILAIPSPISAK